MNTKHVSYGQAHMVLKSGCYHSANLFLLKEIRWYNLFRKQFDSLC